MIYFTADTHYSHIGILRHQPLRATAFSNIDIMDSALIDACNKIVQPDDELWVLGDFIWKATKYGHIRQRLKVRKLHVIQGNHDQPSLRNHVSSLATMGYRRFDGRFIHTTHYPMVSWRNREHGAIHLYGHTHASMETVLDMWFPGRLSMDAGVDNAYRLLGEWRPFSLDEILKHLGVSNAITRNN